MAAASTAAPDVCAPSGSRHTCVAPLKTWPGVQHTDSASSATPRHQQRVIAAVVRVHDPSAARVPLVYMMLNRSSCATVAFAAVDAAECSSDRPKQRARRRRRHDAPVQHRGSSSRIDSMTFRSNLRTVPRPASRQQRPQPGPSAAATAARSPRRATARRRSAPPAAAVGHQAGDLVAATDAEAASAFACGHRSANCRYEWSPSKVSAVLHCDSELPVDQRSQFEHVLSVKCGGGSLPLARRCSAIGGLALRQGRRRRRRNFAPNHPPEIS